LLVRRETFGFAAGVAAVPVGLFDWPFGFRSLR
jgi:hypothetical protein